MLISPQNISKWGVKREYQNFVKDCNLIFLVTHDHMQNFKIVAYLLVACFWLVMMKNLLIIKASLATAEVSAGG
jgi:hypothetical protein